MKFEKMKEIREEKEMKQREIAEILGVDRSTYAGWETGKDTIPLRKLFELSNYYKLSIDYITGLKKRNNYPLLVDSNNNIIWIPNIKKSKFCNKKSENYDIIIRCNERKEDYE